MKDTNFVFPPEKAPCLQWKSATTGDLKKKSLNEAQICIGIAGKGK